MISRLCWIAWLSAGLVGAQNLYPDPSFEQTGVAGVARTGERAAYLKIGAKQHWLPMGDRLAVEPYATYRAEAWARARVAEGAALALYVYQWDSYVWAFSTNVRITATDDWQPVSITFRVPTDRIYFHPLTFLDAADGEAWLDDLTVERIAGPQETIATLAAKARLDNDDARLLVRWYVEHGDFAAAKALLERDLPDGVKADIACVMGLATKDPGTRAECLLAMIANGAAAMNYGERRIAEVSEGVDPEALLTGVKGLLGDGSRADLARAVGQYLRARLGAGGLPQTLAERQARLGSLAAQVAELQNTLPAGSPARVELDSATAAVAAAQAALEKEMAELGRCRVTIHGRPLTPENYAIVMPDRPTPSEERAARDLQAHLERITGRALPLVGLSGAQGQSYLVVGRSPLVEALGVTVDYDSLGLEGIRIKTAGDHLILTGNQRGVLYAVYAFLEDQLGCRWFTPDCATWPTSGQIDLGDLDITYIPPLEYRATDYPNSRPPEFAVRNRLNGAQVQADASWGGHITYQGFVHTFNALLPPEEYFAEHPEYYSEIGGVRVGDRSQLCLTNPEVLRLVTAAVRRWIEQAPQASIISVSQNDWHNYCTCANCTALAEHEGSQSGPLIHFVNAIAEDVAKDYPNIIIDTLAYQYTRKPPRHVKPHPNVAVRLCSIECEFNRPLDSSPTNASFVDDIRGWNAICDRLHIWDYVINYAHCIMPFPNLKVLQPNIRFFIANGVTGVYEEANYFSKGGELAELRTYLMAKLLWNPDYDVEQGMDEFLRAYYGPAAGPLRAYLDEVHRLAVIDDAYHMRIYVGPNAPFLTPPALARYDRWFDQAEAAVAADPVRLHRVQVARLPILYTHIAQGATPAYRLVAEALVPVAGGGPASAVERFEQIARAEGVTRVSEGAEWGALDVFLSRVGGAARELPVVRLAGGGLQAVVVPGLGGRILSLTRGDQELLQVTWAGDGIDPLVGGYKEFSESGYQSPGWREPFEVVEQSAEAVTLRSKQLSNGLVYERRYELATDAPIVRVSTKLTNVTAVERKGRIRVHPCFRLGSAADARVRLGAEEKSLAEGATKECELWLRADARPPGEWTVIDPVGRLTITSRFDPAEVEVCYLNWNGPDHRVNLELWSPERSLATGESLTMRHEYRFGEP